MENNEILSLIDQTMESLSNRLDELDIDDIEGVELSDGKLVIGFEDGAKFIISRQSAANQIWVAEPGGGWHFDYKDGHWICSKRGIELIQSLEDLMSAKLGETVLLK